MSSFIKCNVVILLLMSLITSYDNKKIINIVIPKIRLNQYTDYYQELSDGIKIHEISHQNNKPLVLLGHSGSGRLAVFNDLFLLTVGDKVILKINNDEYTYIINDIYSFEKGQKLKITHNPKQLLLITCDLLDPRKQWVFSSKIAKIDKI